MMALRDRLGDTSHIRGPIEDNRSLKDLVWFRVGGPAEILFQPADEADLQAFLKLAPADVPITVIGHSFGSRAASVGACIGPAIFERTPELTPARIANLVNLQGAFQVSRLFGDSDKGMHFPDACSNVDNVILTASDKDNAMDTAFWGLYAGDERSFARHCPPDAKINCVRADSHGGITPLSAPPKSHITYVDASELIRENAYLSGGGAHSDIYRKEHGVLLNRLLTRRARP